MVHSCCEGREFIILWIGERVGIFQRLDDVFHPAGDSVQSTEMGGTGELMLITRTIIFN